jgi:hypothetical protein
MAPFEFKRQRPPKISQLLVNSAHLAQLIGAGAAAASMMKN